MITEYMSLVFIVAVFALFWYLFRGIRDEEQNPIWGNFFASFLCCVLCIILAYSFLQGNITTTHVVQNESYQVLYQQDNIVANVSINSTNFQYVLHPNGAGMYTVSALNPGYAGLLEDNGTAMAPGKNLTSLTKTMYTYDVLYTQIQDVPCVYLFGFLACCSGGIFVYFCWIVFIKKLLGLEGGDEEGESGGEEE